MRRRLSDAWWAVYNRAHYIEWRVLEAVLGRFASRGLRHAALCLGFDRGLGIGDPARVLGAMREYGVGYELGISVRFAELSSDIREAGEAYRLERMSYAQAPVRSGLELAGRRK